MNFSPRAVARRFGVGAAFLKFCRRPVALFLQSIAEGGPLQQRLTERGRTEMIDAAFGLPPLISPEMDIGASVAFLSGSRYWYQTLFCFASLQRFSPVRITPVIFDDGSFSDETKDPILKVVPWAKFVSVETIEERLDRILPAIRFPSLRTRRKDYVYLRKLTDIHIGASDWTLVLDSDMLFFRKPKDILYWFGQPKPIYLQDVAPSYGYPTKFMTELAGAAVPANVNIGLYALHSSDIDWEMVEHWCGRQLEAFGTNYFQEQALTAMLLGRAKAQPLSAEEYIVRPSLREGKNPRGILHHYVSNSKRSYYQAGWRQVATELADARY